MLERSHLESYICYCKYQKNLNNKTLKAYAIIFLSKQDLNCRVLNQINELIFRYDFFTAND